ncbi:MAG: MBL fold metallo-hydrolase, partial [Salinimicrobium sp.]
MKIKILGTRGKIKPSAPLHKLHSGILIDNKILIDIGERTYLETKPKAIVFTHFHPDHAFFVLENEKFEPQIPLFGPEENELIPKLKVVDQKFQIDDYRFTPVPVIHSLQLKSLAYLIEKDGKKILITGDVAWIEKANLQELPQLDLVITDAS